MKNTNTDFTLSATLAFEEFGKAAQGFEDVITIHPSLEEFALMFNFGKYPENLSIGGSSLSAVEKAHRLAELILEKQGVESDEESFDNLVVNEEIFQNGYYIEKSKFSKEQLEFMQKVLPTYSETTFLVTSEPFDYAYISKGEFSGTTVYALNGKELSFNDIFVHKSQLEENK